MRSLVRGFIALSFAALVGCATGATLRAPSGESIRVPSVRPGALELVASNDAAYLSADPKDATGAPGEGKMVTPYVVRLTRDLPVYRLWSGPLVKNERGETSRMGEWWTFEPPAGTLASFRSRYEVCEIWSSLRWVASCTLKRGSVVVVGPGQSVSAQTCQRPPESYPANFRDMQVYIHEAWKQANLKCPPAGADYLDDPVDISTTSR